MATRADYEAAQNPSGGEGTLADLKKKLEQAKGAKARFIPIWELCRAYFTGDQWVFWNRTRLDRPKLDSNKTLVVDNRINPIVRTEVAKMSKQRPTFQVAPTTADQDDLDSAQMGEKVLDFLWQHLALRIKLENALLWSRVCSAGFLKCTWDPTKGDAFEVTLDEQGQLVQDASGYPARTKDLKHPETGQLPQGYSPTMIATGDVSVEVCSPFEIFPDPLAKTLDECEWVIQETIVSQEYIRARWHINMEPDTPLAAGLSEVRIPSTMEGGTEYKGIKLYEYWSIPNSQSETGQRVVWAKDKILESGPNPYEKLPYVMFRSIPVPGRFWPNSITELLRGPQTELNKIKSQIIENAARIGNPVVLMSREANIQMAGVPGEEVEYDDLSPNSAPKYMEPPNMPQYVIEQISRIETSMQEISGQHEVSNAQVPPGVKAASAINLLQEADDTRLGPGIYDMEESLGKLGTMILEIVARYWTNERLIMVTGENHQVDAISFKGAALKENTQVEVQTGSALPRSKAAKQAAIQDMLNLVFQYEGSMPINRRQLAKAMKDLEAGGLEKLWGDISQDETQINRENHILSGGEAVKIHPYDNQLLHLEGHQEYQRTSAYERLDDVTKKLIELHVQEHRLQYLRSVMPQQPVEQEQHVETAPPPPPESKPSEGGSSNG